MRELMEISLIFAKNLLLVETFKMCNQSILKSQFLKKNFFLSKIKKSKFNFLSVFYIHFKFIEITNIIYI